METAPGVIAPDAAGMRAAKAAAKGTQPEPVPGASRL